MSSPRTGTIGIARPSAGATLRSRLRGFPVALGLAVVRTPEITVGALAVVVSAIGTWVPSVWYDEAATISSARRSWPDLWAELHSVDAVHGLYYALMHVWFWLVGYSPFTLRFPSVLAVGVAAGLVVALGRRLGGLRLGIVSGIVFVMLPRVSWASSEGRPYATITALSVCLTLVGLTAVRRTRAGRGGRWWIAYGVLAAVAVVFNVYLALAIVAHGVALLWTAVAQRSARRHDLLTARDGVPPGPLVTRRTGVLWLVSAGAAAAVVAPFVLAVIGQAKQVGWIKDLSIGTVRQVVATSWFGASWIWAALGWSLIALAVVATTVAVRRAAPSARSLLRAQAVRVALPLAVVPTAALVGATALGEHLWSPKYASLSLPAVALLIGLGITTIRPRRWLAVAVTLLVLALVPAMVAARLPHAKQDSHWADAARIVSSERSFAPDADEGVVYGSVWGHPTTTAQVIADAYPQAFAGMTDLAVRTDGAQQGVLWNRNGDVATTLPSRLGDIDTVWFVGGTPKARNLRPELTTTLAERGFRAVEHWRTGEVVITKYVRG